MIQPKHQQHHFNQVAHIIGAALKAYPRALPVSTGIWSHETMARKLREAVEAKQLYHWPSEHINDELFVQHADDLGTSIKTLSGEVKLYYGSRAGLKNIETQAVGQAAVNEQLTPGAYYVDFQDCDDHRIKCFIEIIASDRIKPLPNFVITGLTPEQANKLEALYPIGFVPVDGHQNTWQLIT